MVLAFKKAERGQFLVLAQCAPLSSSAPPGSLGCWPTKHLPAAPAARQAGGALVILTFLSAGAPSHCSSHKLWQLQLATTGARPARPEWAQRSASIRIMLGGLSLLPDLERYYKSSVPDSIAAAIWFTGTTKKSHAYVTVTDGFLILDHEDPSRASGFHSHHHIDDKSPRALP